MMTASQNIGDPLLASDLPQGVSTYLSGTSRWFVGYEVVSSGDKIQRRVVRVSFAEVSTLLAGGTVSGDGPQVPSASSLHPMGNGLSVVGMDELGRLSSSARADSVYILGYLSEGGKHRSCVMSVATLGAYLGANSR